MTDKLVGRRILVKGIVQGVGFRPRVYGYAKESNLTGWVCNSSRGVEIEITGEETNTAAFIQELKTTPPPLAKIDSFEVVEIPAAHYPDFRIVTSLAEPDEFLPISSDIATCPDCQNELFDPSNRRYRYPFINCTNCGPRFTIIKDIPYDRPNTTMAPFVMCPDCQKEYENPTDRRFHAQPTACPVCGPKLRLISSQGELAAEEKVIQKSRELIKAGKIVAIKGLGGYLLACDATNPIAVETLRSRKKRSQKPFALMAFNQEEIENYCNIFSEESELLHSIQHPIVLLKKKITNEITEHIAPRQSRLGFMLPYTPLHLLLLEPAADFPKVLVMTSGNLSEEPIAYEDSEAFDRLASIADAFLTNDREILMRTDDSVVSVVDHHPYPIRRARGYAPAPIHLYKSVPTILATGGELKNAFCLTKQRYAFVSHHIGDLQNYETVQAFESGIEHFEKLFRVKPEAIAADLHPNYLSTVYAQERSHKDNLPLIGVQHHHAHLAACLADNGWKSEKPVIGFCFDGTGYGADSAIWGGEVLVGGYKTYARTHHLSYMPLPGGDAAIQRPYRIGLAYLWKAGIKWDIVLPSFQEAEENELTILLKLLEQGINTVDTSSMGRLFDVVSSMLGVCQRASYEGQAAIELESIIDPDEKGFYDMIIDGSVINIPNLLNSILQDIQNGIGVAIIAAKFHNSLVQLVDRLSLSLAKQFDTHTVALSGGVWQNRFLLEKSIGLLHDHGFEVLIHNQVPTNDGGISLGQAVVAAALLEK